MFSSPSEHDRIMKRFEDHDRYLIEANQSIVEFRRAQLENHAKVCSLIGDMARLVVSSTDMLERHQAGVLETAKAQSANKVLRSINREESILRPLQKEFPSGGEADGGMHLAFRLRPDGVENWQSWPPLATPLIGEVPPEGMFPRSVNDLEKFSHEQILRLIAFYNDSFGIALDDAIELRCDKLRRWCTLS